MSTTLTLGPVTLQLPLVANDLGDVRDRHGVTIASTDDVPLATLFAAAPDLLVAAEAVIAAYESEGDVIGYDLAMTALRTAIARARGGA